MRILQLRRLPAGLSGILFFLMLVCIYAAMFLVDRQSEKALTELQGAFADCYEGIQAQRLASLADPEDAAFQEDAVSPKVDKLGMSIAIDRFRNLSNIQWLPQQESHAIILDEAWQNWLEAQGSSPSREAESIQLLKAIKLADAHLEELRHHVINAFDLIIFLSGVLFSLGTAGSIAFYSRLRQSQLKEEFAAANLKKALESEDGIRRTIAMELHDDIAQDIAAARMLCERMNRNGANTLELASRAARNLGIVNQKIQTLCTELRPPALEETGLQEAVRALCEAEEGRHSKPLRFIPGGNIPRLQSQVEANLYRIIREAVVNASKHARDGIIEVRTWITGAGSSPKTLSIEIRDSGFEQGAEEGSRGFGFGIAAMQERADLIGAALSVQLDPAGSLVRIIVPLKESGRKEQGWQEH